MGGIGHSRRLAVVATVLGLAIAGVPAMTWATATQVTAGTPIQGTDVGLDGIPPTRLRTQTSDARGRVTFQRLPAGRYVILIPEASRLGGPVRLRITSSESRTEIVSSPIAPREGRAYANDARGGRIVITLRAEGWVSGGITAEDDWESPVI